MSVFCCLGFYSIVLASLKMHNVHKCTSNTALSYTTIMTSLTVISHSLLDCGDDFEDVFGKGRAKDE